MKVFLAVIFIAILAAGAYIRNGIWYNDITLWEDAVVKSPGKGRVHHNLGRAYDEARYPRAAFEQYLIATSLDPDLARAHESLGISYVSFGKIDDARRELQTALQLDPELRQARMFLEYISKQTIPSR